MNNLKTITIKQFERAKKLHDEIVSIDAEIIEIEKLANTVANDNCDLSFGVKVENHSKIKEEKKDFEDEKNSIMSMYGGLFNYSWVSPLTPKDEHNSHVDKYRFKFTDTDCLKVLSIILAIKYERRNTLLNEINRLGIKF